VWLSLVLIVLAAMLVSVVWSGLLGVPWVPTPMDVVHQKFAMAKVGLSDVVYDSGCGDGRLIITVARDYGAQAMGMEVDPLRYLWCQMRTTVLRLREHVRTVYGSIFAQDLSDAYVMTCYLLQDTNNPSAHMVPAKDGFLFLCMNEDDAPLRHHPRWRR